MRELRAYAAQLISLGGSALLTFGTALLMSPEDRGALAIFMLIASIGSYAYGLGVPSQALQLAARGDFVGVRGLFLTQVPIAFLLGGATVAFLLIVPVFPFVTPTVIWMSAAAAAVGALANLVSWVEYGLGRYFVATLLRGLVPLSAFAVTLVAAAVSALSVDVVVWAYVSAQTLALVYLLARNWARLRGGLPTLQVVAKCYSSAFRYFVLQALVMVLARIPTIAAGIWYGASATAAVSIALSLTEVQASLPQMRSAITFTESSRSEKPRLTKTQLRSAVMALIPGVVVVMIAAVVVSFVFDEAYADTWQLVAIMSLGVAVMGIGASALNVLTIRNQLGIAQVAVAAAVGLAILAFAIELPLLSALACWSMLSALVGVGVCVLAFRPGGRTY